MTNPGTLTDWITIFSPGQSVDDGGGGRLPAGPETTLETWASVTPLPAKSALIDGKWVTTQFYRVVIRYVNNEELRYADRIECGSLRISVDSIVPDAKKTVTTIIGHGK